MDSEGTGRERGRNEVDGQMFVYHRPFSDESKLISLEIENIES